MTEDKPIEFYFEFASPYGYFASTKIDAIAAKYGRTVDWKPIMLGAALQATGSQPNVLIPIKGEYFKNAYRMPEPPHSAFHSNWDER